MQISLFYSIVVFRRCVDMVKSSQYVELANDLEINKAITYLRQKDFKQVRASVHEHHKLTERACSRAASRAETLKGDVLYHQV